MSKNHKLFYGSSYDRGLQHILQMWPKIIEKFPDATLDVCYGWELFDLGYKDNPERQAWKERITKQMGQPGITHHGRVGKAELKKIRQSCGIWVYPTHFTEINCITGLECQHDGLVPVVMALAALKETVYSGTKVEGDIYDDEAKEAFIEALFSYMSDEKLWKQESDRARSLSTNYSWDKIATAWAKHFI